MKLSRIPAVGVAVALVAASTFFVVTPAAAANFYYDAADFGQEPPSPSTYPAGFDWFYGDVTSDGDIDWEAGGMEMNNGTNINGNVQILNQDVSTPAPGGLATLADNSSVLSDTGEWTFQLPLFANPTTGPQAFTTLRPAAQGNSAVDSTLQWITSQVIPTDGGGVAYAAGASATLVQFEAALNALDSYQLLAFGLFFTTADTDTIHAIRFDGDWSIFTPEPLATVVPGALSVADFTNTAKGVTATVTGFLPGELTGWWLGLPDGDYTPIGQVFADTTGTATLEFVAPAGAVAGEYSLWVDSQYFVDIGGTFVEVFFDVTPNALAATGVDASGAGMLAGILLITGLGVMLVRRRANALR